MICFDGFNHEKELFKGHSPQKTTAVFIKENIFMQRVIAKKERRSDLIAEISDSIKKKYINLSFDFILK